MEVILLPNDKSTENINYGLKTLSTWKFVLIYPLYIILYSWLLASMHGNKDFTGFQGLGIGLSILIYWLCSFVFLIIGSVLSTRGFWNKKFYTLYFPQNSFLTVSFLASHIILIFASAASIESTFYICAVPFLGLSVVYFSRLLFYR